MNPAPVSLYISACAADAALRDRLALHLGPLQQQGRVRIFHAGLLEPGQEHDEQQRRLAGADVILLLLSADYLSACHGEAGLALQRHRLGEAWTIPVLLHPVDIHGSAFEQLQLLPSSGKPVSLHRSRDDAWLGVVKGVRRALDGRPACSPLDVLRQDAEGAPLYLTSELLDFSLALRLRLDRPCGDLLADVVSALSLLAQVSDPRHPRLGIACRYLLARPDQDQTLLLGRTLAEQGVVAGEVLALEVRHSPLSPPQGYDGEEAVYRHSPEELAGAACAALRRHLAEAGF